MFEFQNADISPRARQAFAEFPSMDVHETQEMIKAARHIDQALGILKRGYAHGSMSEHDHDDFLSHIEDAEDILETLGVLEDHEYIRDDLEPRAAELLDVDSVDAGDDADDLASTESWLFGSAEDESPGF